VGWVARSRGFDDQQVVERAMELFWTKGYTATSVSDLAGTLGVYPGSLYRTFGDKHALFLRALAHYRDSQARALTFSQRLYVIRRCSKWTSTSAARTMSPSRLGLSVVCCRVFHRCVSREKPRSPRQRKARSRAL